MKDKFLIRTLVSFGETEEFYERDQLKELVGIDEDHKDYYEYEVVQVNKTTEIPTRYGDDNTPCRIREMINLLTRAERKGATHASIFFHSSHRQYEVSGFNYKLPDEEANRILREGKHAEAQERRNAAIMKLKEFAKSEGIEIEIKR